MIKYRARVPLIFLPIPSWPVAAGCRGPGISATLLLAVRNDNATTIMTVEHGLDILVETVVPHVDAIHAPVVELWRIYEPDNRECKL